MNENNFSSICLGCLPFGTRVEESESIKMIDYAYENGINFLDTANRYSDGKSEICIGKAVKGRREKFCIATKVGLDGNLKFDYILEQADQSLRRLQTDYIDVYYLHTPDYSTPIEETLEALAVLKEKGKIREYAVSNYAAWQIEEMCWKGEETGAGKPVMAEVVYNLICRTIEPEMVPFAEARKIKVAVYNPLAGGLLTGKYEGNKVPEGTRFDWKWNNMGKIYKERYFNERNMTACRLFAEIAKTIEATPTELALRWCASQSFVSSVIIGATKMGQLKENIQALQKNALPETLMKECTNIYDFVFGIPFSYNR